MHKDVAEQSLRPLEAGEIRLRVHGRHTDGRGDLVPGSGFAQKLAILLRGIRAADAAVNGKVKHEYVISDLRISSAVVELREKEIRNHALLDNRSGISAFDDCINAIRQGSVERALSFGKFPVYVSQLAKGSGSRFGYAELWFPRESPLRVDEFLREQTEAVVERPQAQAYTELHRRWYKGAAYGTFEGEVKEVDLRGALPEIKLILTAGAKELNCVFVMWTSNE